MAGDWRTGIGGVYMISVLTRCAQAAALFGVSSTHSRGPEVTLRGDPGDFGEEGASSVASMAAGGPARARIASKATCNGRRGLQGIVVRFAV